VDRRAAGAPIGAEVGPRSKTGILSTYRFLQSEQRGRARAHPRSEVAFLIELNCMEPPERLYSYPASGCLETEKSDRARG
jgi:hypothetical protein